MDYYVKNVHLSLHYTSAHFTGTCKFIGCGKKAHGKFNFCSKTHGDQYAKQKRFNCFGAVTTATKCRDCPNSAAFVRRTSRWSPVCETCYNRNLYQISRSTTQRRCRECGCTAYEKYPMCYRCLKKCDQCKMQPAYFDKRSRRHSNLCQDCFRRNASGRRETPSNCPILPFQIQHHSKEKEYGKPEAMRSCEDPKQRLCAKCSARPSYSDPRIGNCSNKCQKCIHRVTDLSSFYKLPLKLEYGNGQQPLPRLCNNKTWQYWLKTVAAGDKLPKAESLMLASHLGQLCLSLRPHTCEEKTNEHPADNLTPQQNVCVEIFLAIYRNDKQFIKRVFDDLPRYLSQQYQYYGDIKVRDIVDLYGRTPLLEAICEENEEIVELLLHYSPEEIVNKCDNVPIHPLVACMAISSNAKLFQMLVQKGSQIDRAVVTGLFKNYPKIEKLLREWFQIFSGNPFLEQAFNVLMSGARLVSFPDVDLLQLLFQNSSRVKSPPLSILKSYSDFKFLTRLKSGVQGDVNLLEHRFSRKCYVAKTYKETNLEVLIGTITELDHLHMMSHLEQAVTFQGVVIDYPVGNSLRPALLLDYVEGGDLEDYLRRLADNNEFLSNKEILNLAKSATRTIGEMHMKDRLHLDIHPRNFLLSNDPATGVTPHLIIADFGLSKHMPNKIPVCTEGDLKPWRVGDPAALSSNFATEKSDIYSLAMLMWQICHPGQTIFDECVEPEELMKLFEEAKKNNEHIKIPLLQECILGDLIWDMTVMRPDRRPTIRQILRRIENLERQLQVGVAKSPSIDFQPPRVRPVGSGGDYFDENGRLMAQGDSSAGMAGRNGCYFDETGDKELNVRVSY